MLDQWRELWCNFEYSQVIRKRKHLNNHSALTSNTNTWSVDIEQKMNYSTLTKNFRSVLESSDVSSNLSSGLDESLNRNNICVNRILESSETVCASAPFSPATLIGVDVRLALRLPGALEDRPLDAVFKKAAGGVFCVGRWLPERPRPQLFVLVATLPEPPRMLLRPPPRPRPPELDLFMMVLRRK